MRLVNIEGRPHCYTVILKIAQPHCMLIRTGTAAGLAQIFTGIRGETRLVTACTSFVTAHTTFGIHYPIVYKLDQGQLRVSLTSINIKYDSSLKQTIPMLSKLNLRYLILIMQIKLEYNGASIELAKTICKWCS